MERYLPLIEEVISRISTVTFANHLAFMETLQQYKEDLSLFLQHMIHCYKALLADESSCVSMSVAIIRLLTWQTSLRLFMHYVRIYIQLPYRSATFTVSFWNRNVARRDRRFCTLGVVHTCVCTLLQAHCGCTLYRVAE